MVSVFGIREMSLEEDVKGGMGNGVFKMEGESISAGLGGLGMVEGLGLG